jgi:DNA-binding NtrC family response regulator
MRGVFRLIEEAARIEAPVLLQGERGTGRRRIAEIIHRLSARSSGPFHAFFCADGSRSSFLQSLLSASGGTLFLDEIETLPLELLGLLEDVVETASIHLHGVRQPVLQHRYVSSCSGNFDDLTMRSSLSARLFYHLKTLEIVVPPLRDRAEDLPTLATRFLHEFAAQAPKKVSGFSEEVLKALSEYLWPGNLPELQNAVHNAVLRTTGELIRFSDLPSQVRRVYAKPRPQVSVLDSATLKGRMEDPEKQVLLDELRKYHGNIRQTAAALNVSRTTLYNKLKKFSVDPDLLRA